ncbi:MAG: hypothetical protein R6V56_05400 [Lentisphaeria bacterium]
MQTGNKKVTVLGLGGGGVSIAGHFAKLAGDGPFEVCAADTDFRSLNNTQGLITIPLGEEWDCSSGCGGDAQLGEKAAGASAEALQELISGSALLIVTAGLGGGTATGAVRTVARLAKEARIPCFFVVTVPFAFEGNWRRQQANSVLEPLRQVTDSVIVVKSDLLFTSLQADTPAAKAFEMADELLAKSLHGLAATVWADWMLTADFAAIRGLLRKAPENANLGVGSGNGEDRWQQAIEEFVECPLIGGPETLKEADAAVVTLLTRQEISVGELQKTLSSLQKYFSDNAQVLVGACHSQLCSSEVQITGVLCRRAKSVNPPSQSQFKSRPEPSDRKPSPTPATKKNKATPVQEELPLQEQTLGIFSGSRPTTIRGENLDIPTFQRRGIHINAGD